MSRKPSKRTELFAWWRAALEGSAPPPVNETPQAGYYKRRLVKGGPWVPVAIWVEQEIGECGELLAPEIIKCSVDGKIADAVSEWGYCCSHPISKQEYVRLAKKTVLEINDGEHFPRRPIDLLSVTPPTFKRETQ